jgi:XTP/dITP diphosphohydrolase
MCSALRDQKVARPTAGSAGDSEAVRRSWEAIKTEEKATRKTGQNGRQSVGPDHVQESDAAAGFEAAPSMSPLSDRLAPKVRAQPALAGAMAISRKAAAAGFEWDDLDGVWEKVHEELDELKQAVAEAATGATPTPRRSWGMCCSPW